VKNLEIIQGDERDVIFISVGYGKDKSGKLHMNFGHINQEGGHRRLNVLVTRARYRLEIFTSIRGDDFDLSKTNSFGVHLLKKYLDFAEKGYIVLLQDIDSTKGGFSESPFEESVYNTLVSRDINVIKQLGCSGYRIDLAIVDDEKPGRYLLGIECDGASYHSCYTARDRDRLRQQILEDLGWNIYRIWSTDWFNNPKREFGNLLEAIRKAKKREYKKN
jgi:very-short-patch-repair endonuclease